MSVETKQMKLSDIKFDGTIYPRKTHSSAKVQEYTANLEAIEAKENFMSLSANGNLLDGRHRHLAYLTKFAEKEADTIVTVFWYADIVEKKDEYTKAIELNNAHGQQLSMEDKRQSCINLYAKYNYSLEVIAQIVSVSKSFATAATKTFRENEEQLLNEKIFDLWMQCYTEREIAEQVNQSFMTIQRKTEDFVTESIKNSNVTKSCIFEDDFTPPVYNIWRKLEKTNEVEHFGNSEPTWLENLIYLYTQPFDIVVDPFAGGGSTIDICKKRFRRYWCSDRKPIVSRQHEIRLMDVTTSFATLNKNWSNVSLTFLDPPYWKQAEGQYSTDAQDLANMPLEEFNTTLGKTIKGIARKQSKGAIALMMQPTQWKTNEAHDWTDHVLEMCWFVKQKVKNLTLKNRISVPYSTEQCNAQMVNEAKAQKFCLCLTRELIVWEVN